MTLPAAPGLTGDDADAHRPVPADRPLLPPLEYLLLADTLAARYAEVFPDRPEWLTAERVDWPTPEAAAAAVERLLQRLNSLFPVHDEIWDADLETIRWRLAEIPVMPMGFDVWHDDWDYFKEPIPYLLHLVYSRGDGWRDTGRDHFAELYPDHLLPAGLDLETVAAALRRLSADLTAGQPEALDALPDLMAMLEQATGNVWLDVGEVGLAEGGGYPDWNPATVAWLQEEWAAAQPVLDGVRQLLAWCHDEEAERPARLAAVRDRLLVAHARSVTDDS